jgi:hypothetical protein
MSEIEYVSKRFSGGSLEIIAQANTICQDWASQGYDLTLRQLYYRFIALDWFPDDRWFWWNESRRKWIRDPEHLNPASTKNADPNYKWLGSIINDARMAGLLDWDYIVDRTREIEEPNSWDSPASIVDAAAQGYYIDRWEGQKYHPEVWVEKDALEGIVERAADYHRVPWFSCRGYTSQSGMWQAAQRLGEYIIAGQIPVIIHLGDHDPSGVDMTRDIQDRLNTFLLQDYLNVQWPDADDEWVDHDDIVVHMAEWIEHMKEIEVDSTELPVWVRRVALNMNQIREFNPPPSPAKITDARARGYIRQYGEDSWELDALEPNVLVSLIRSEISELIEWPLWEETVRRETDERSRLYDVARRFREGESDRDEEE